MTNRGNFFNTRPAPPGRRFQIATVALAVLAVLVLATVFTSFYTIGPDSVGVVTRFGRYTSITQPGLHFKLPLGIDRVQAVAVLRQQKQEFGFRTLQAGVHTQYETGDYSDESLMVTGDLNAAVVEWSVQYRVNDPKAYVFNVRDPVDTLRYASEAVMRQVVGDHTVDEVLTVQRQQVGDDSLTKLQALMDEYKMGIHIDRVVLQDVTPPDAVKAAFSQVNEAQQEREKLINEARAQYNQVIPRAKGEAQQQIQAAEGYAAQRVNEAQGDANRFNAIFTEYRKAPEATRGRLYLETMGEVIPRLGRKIVIDDRVRSLLPMLPLSTDTTPTEEKQ